MRIRFLLCAAVSALVAPFGSPAHAGPYCVVLDWTDGDACYFEAPAGEFVFGGIATELRDGDRYPWVAVQVTFQGRVVASCFDQGTDAEPAQCVGRARALPTVSHVCEVFGTGGPTFHCADPPPLPSPVG